MKNNFDREIDYHGYFPLDAVHELEEELFCSHNESILIIHGIGSGKVKRAVRDFVRGPGRRHISSFDFGEDLGIPGGDGVVVVWT